MQRSMLASTRKKRLNPTFFFFSTKQLTRKLQESKAPVIGKISVGTNLFFGRGLIGGAVPALGVSYRLSRTIHSPTSAWSGDRRCNQPMVQSLAWALLDFVLCTLYSIIHYPYSSVNNNIIASSWSSKSLCIVPSCSSLHFHFYRVYVGTRVFDSTVWCSSNPNPPFLWFHATEITFPS